MLGTNTHCTWLGTTGSARWNLKMKSLTFFQGERVHEDINSSLMTLNTEPDSFIKLRQVSTPCDNKRYLKNHPVAQMVESCTFKCESGMFWFSPCIGQF